MTSTYDRRAEDLVADELLRLEPRVVPAVAEALCAAGFRFSHGEIEVFYRQAWHALLSALQAGDPPADAEEFLTQAAFRRAADEFRVTHPDSALEPEMLEAVGIQDPVGETLGQRRALAAAARELESELSQRELQPAALRLLHGVVPGKIEDVLGLPGRRLSEIAAAAGATIDSAIADVGEPAWCEQHASLINRFALGGFGPSSDGYHDAVRHLKTCEGCRAHVLRARALAAATIPSGQMLVVLTGSARLGAQAGVSDSAPLGAPRAASPLAGTTKSSLPPKRLIVGVLAGALYVAIFLYAAFGHFGAGRPVPATGFATTSVGTVAGQVDAAAQERRRERAARERRAKRAQAERRAAAKRRAARRAAARRAANARAATPVAQPQPVATQPQTNAPAAAPHSTPKPQPKPSTDPSEEFGN